MVDGGGSVLLDGYKRYIYVLLFRIEDCITILTSIRDCTYSIVMLHIVLVNMIRGT